MNKLMTKEISESQFVTKVHWTVEAIHGILKRKNKFLDHIFDNKVLSKLKNLILYCILHSK